MSTSKKVRTRHSGVYQRGDSYWWIVDVGRRGGRRQRATGTARTLKEAIAARSKARTDGLANTFVPPTRATLEEFVEKTWYPALEASELKPNTIGYYRNRMDHILHELGGLRMSELSPSVFDRLWQRLAAEGMSRASLHGTKTTARKALDHARRKSVVSRNPVVDSDVPNVQGSKRTEWWSPSELSTWIRSTEGDRLHALWAVLVSTGCRRGEALALRWDDLDQTGSPSNATG